MPHPHSVSINTAPTISVRITVGGSIHPNHDINICLFTLALTRPKYGGAETRRGYPTGLANVGFKIFPAHLRDAQPDTYVVLGVMNKKLELLGFVSVQFVPLEDVRRAAG